MARQPGQPGDAVRKQHPDYLVKELADLKRDFREFRQALAQQTGMSFVGGQIVIDADSVLRTSDFDGTTSPPAAGNNGVAISDGTIIANAAVFKDLIIDDDALTNPVKTGGANNIGSGFTWTTSFVARASLTFTVPAGFTTADVLAMGTTSTTVAGAPAGAIYLLAAVTIDGNGAASANSSLMTSGGGITVPACWAQKLTGLSGGDTFDVNTYGAYQSASGGSVPAGSSGAARVSAIVTFTR